MKLNIITSVHRVAYPVSFGFAVGALGATALYSLGNASPAGAMVWFAVSLCIGMLVGFIRRNYLISDLLETFEDIHASKHAESYLRQHAARVYHRYTVQGGSSYEATHDAAEREYNNTRERYLRLGLIKQDELLYDSCIREAVPMPFRPIGMTSM